MTQAPGCEPELERELRELVRAQLGAGIERLEPLHGVSFGHRRFLRLWLDRDEPRTLVARIDRGEPAPGVLPEPPLEPLRAFLESHGLPVPRRLGGDAERGVDLLEDLGARDLLHAARDATPDALRALYAEACDLVPRLQALADPGTGLAAFARRYDATLIDVKARRFAAASLPAGLGRAASAAEAACVREAFAAVAERLAEGPMRLAHRDFQSTNLMVRDAPPGQRLFLVDVQGALLAPPEYDLVCLLRGSYVVLPEPTVSELAERVRPRLPDTPPADEFRRRFDLITIVRKGKDHALWHELAARGRPEALAYAPATFAYVRGAARRSARLDPRLARFAELCDALAPRLAPGDSACAP